MVNFKFRLTVIDAFRVVKNPAQFILIACHLSEATSHRIHGVDWAHVAIL